jgi:hypothetical protein
MRLIDADALSRAMYHEAFEKDTDLQKWDSGCWIRYKMFENKIEEAPTVDVLDKITEEIEKYNADCGKPEDIGYFSEVNQRTKGAYETCLRIINYWRNEVNE